jgi:ankyrin repeat protein
MSLAQIVGEKSTSKILCNFLTGMTVADTSEPVKIPYTVQKLFRACSINNITWIRQNLDFLSKKELNFLDNLRISPLYLSVSKGFVPIVKYLVKIGAKLELKNEFGNTVMHKAMIKGGKVKFRGRMK